MTEAFEYSVPSECTDTQGAIDPKGPGNVQEPWPEPQPLPNGLPSVRPFELDMLPETAQAWIGDIAEHMRCPTLITWELPT